MCQIISLCGDWGLAGNRWGKAMKSWKPGKPCYEPSLAQPDFQSEIPTVRAAVRLQAEMADHMPFAEGSLVGINHPCKGNLSESTDILNLAANTSEISVCWWCSLELAPFQKAPLGLPLWLIERGLSLILALCHERKKIWSRKTLFTSTSRNLEQPLSGHL